MRVTEDPRRGGVAREAFPAVRIAKVRLQRPDKLSAQDYPPTVCLYLRARRSLGQRGVNQGAFAIYRVLR